MRVQNRCPTHRRPHPPNRPLRLRPLAFIAGFTPTRHEQTITAGAITKAVMLDGAAIGFRVHSTGTVEQPSLACQTWNGAHMTDARRDAIHDRIRFYLSLDDDLRGFYAIGAADPAFAPVMHSLYGYHQVKFLTPFECVCWAILSPRTPMTMARPEGPHGHARRRRDRGGWDAPHGLPGG